jgi:hypothetical protein
MHQLHVTYKTPKRKIQKNKTIEITNHEFQTYCYDYASNVELWKRAIIHQFFAEGKIVTQLNYTNKNAKR